MFIAYIGSITFFTHSHIVNGVTIVHSHPFKGDADHEHTTAEFELIQLLSSIYITGAVILSLLLALLPVAIRIAPFIPPAVSLRSEREPNTPLRAPPAFYA